MTMTIREQLLAQGMTEDQFSNWQSDLYVLKTPVSEKFVSEFQFKQQVKTFVLRSQTETQTWYEIPFGFMDEYMAEKRGQKRGR